MITSLKKPFFFWLVLGRAYIKTLHYNFQVDMSLTSKHHAKLPVPKQANVNQNKIMKREVLIINVTQDKCKIETRQPSLFLRTLQT